MKIRDLFLKPIDRPIDGVIKADDERNLETELEEYVVTRDVARGLSILTERYLDELTANGVWISGFFGSGKSHLLKILSLVLGDRSLMSGAHPADLLLPKVEDEIVRANLRRCVLIPSQSVLFNIDQKYDSIGGDHQAPILEVFVKVLNELQGYFGKQGYVAQFEYDLDMRAAFQPFKETYERVNGSPWERDREAIATARKAAFGRAYAEHFGVTEAEAYSVMRQVREDYRVSVEDLAKRVKAYIDRQPPGFRLNFFIDEVGQFIGQDSKLMLNLQTVTETLGTVCGGRSWVSVTSQADLEGVLGTFRGLEAQDITKIQGRFKTKITLASADVREVIQKRLLAKKEDEPEVLTAIYDGEKNNLQTLFRFGDNSINFQGWRGSDEFCGLYPFHTYAFDLFQLAIKQLSGHDIFTGKYLSVGERSMLAVFQEVAKAVRDQEVGRLATFDLMYDGLAASIRGDMQTSIMMAERQLGPGFPIRILKALFLLKWVREFKATVRNVAILLIDRPDVDIRQHEADVRKALALLESQSYLQRHGEVYEFLTDTEKDVEVEIKATDIEESRVLDLLGKMFFTDVLHDQKIRFEGNGQDYGYARKLDDQVIGKDAEIAINIITPEHRNHGNEPVLISQSLGKGELLAVLPVDERLLQQARLYLKTQKYVQQNSGTEDETRRAVLEQRGQQNSLRRSDMQELATESLEAARLYLNGARLDIGPGDARSRFARAGQALINFAYPSLRMLKGTLNEDSLIAALTAPEDMWRGDLLEPAEAEQEILTYVMRNQDNGDRTSIEEMVRSFGRRPYGWHPMAVLTLVGRLFRMGKVELRGPDLLDARTALESLRNSRRHAAIRVRLQEQYDQTMVNALKAFHHAFFDHPNGGTDARSVGRLTAEAFGAEAVQLRALLPQASRYRFLEPLRAPLDTITRLAEADPNYLLKSLADYREQLLAAKEQVIAPLKAFMNGAQRKAYDEVIDFLKQEEANFAELPAEEVQPIRDLAAAEQPYQGSLIPNAKAAAASLRALLTARLAEAREEALASLAEHEARLLGLDDLTALDEGKQQRVLAATEAARTDIGSQRFLTGIRDRLQRYVTAEYPQQLELAAALAEPPPKPAPSGGGGAPPPPPPPVVAYVPAARLKPLCNLPYIASVADLDLWLAALRLAAEAELAKGKRISL
ncbi:MAG: BREX system P-loop protein BrxC [Ardenticatenia bacterium]|nr:BREX system P-loop protein BrxC [Ardenticatenia bacterium]